MSGWRTQQKRELQPGEREHGRYGRRTFWYKLVRKSWESAVKALFGRHYSVDWTTGLRETASGGERNSNAQKISGVM